MRLRDMMTPDQREDIIRSLTIIEEKLAEPGALYDIEGKREAIRLQKNLRSYFQSLAYDVDKIDWKENFERFSLVSNIPELVAKYRDPVSGRLTPDNYHAALNDAMRRIEPFVEKHNVELFTVLQDSLEKSYSGGAVNFWKAMPEGQNVPGGEGSLKRTDQSLKSRALEWSKQHAAVLVTNVDEATKEKISKIMAETIDEGKGLHEARRRIQKELEINMTRERAQMIARTESSGAWNRGTWDQLKERGIRYKGIVTHDPCEICQAMKAAGPIPIDVPFPRIKGKPSKMTHDQYPPFHPRCYCSLVGKEAPAEKEIHGQTEDTMVKTVPSHDRPTVPNSVPEPQKVPDPVKQIEMTKSLETVPQNKTVEQTPDSNPIQGGVSSPPKNIEPPEQKKKDISYDPEIPLKAWEEQKDIQSAERAAKELFPNIVFDLQKGHIDTINPTLNQFTILANEFPQVVSEMEKITVGVVSGYALVSNDGKNLTINEENYNNPIDYLRQLIFSSEIGYIVGNIPEEDLIKSQITHEFAHIIDEYYRRKKGIPLSQAQRIYDIRVSLKAFEVMQGISQYAASIYKESPIMNNHEFYAEIFRMIKHCKNPTELAKIVYSISMQELKEI